MKENFQKAIAYFNKFVQSDWFIVLNALLILIGWCFDGWVAVLCVVTVLNVLPLFLGKSTKHMLILFTMFMFVISANRHALDNFAPLLVLVILLFAGMIFSVIRYKRDWSFMHPTRIKGFHCSLIALIIPFAFGGVGSPYEHPLAVLAAFALIFVMAIGYTIMFATTNDSEDKEKLPEYLLKILFAVGILISIQLIIYFARLGGIEQIKNAILTRDIEIGWAGKNNVAPTISLCIPASLYFCIKKNKLAPIFAIVALLEYALLFTTSCRGAILFTTLALPPMLMYTIVKSENKVAFGITVSVAFAVAIMLVAYFGEFVTEVVGSFLSKGLDSSGRTDWLYPEAIEAFKKWWFFGSGWDYRLGEFAHDNYTPYWYHSTALQILATMGLVGVISFVAFYFWRYRSMLALRKNPAVIMLLAGLLMFDLYGMIDTNFFGPTFFLILLVISLVVDVNLPEGKCRAFGGRNPFLDIANGCKWIVAWVKAKTGKGSAKTDKDSAKPENVALEDNTAKSDEEAQ